MERGFALRPPRGGRHHGGTTVATVSEFLSTPSVRRATQTHHGARHTVHISIRALREEGDRYIDNLPDEDVAFLSTPSARRATSAPMLWIFLCSYFYPRPPRGGRRHWHIGQSLTLQFLSTPSARRATNKIGRILVLPRISIHALREEGDPLQRGRRGGRF